MGKTYYATAWGDPDFFAKLENAVPAQFNVGEETPVQLFAADFDTCPDCKVVVSLSHGEIQAEFSKSGAPMGPAVKKGPGSWTFSLETAGGIYKLEVHERTVEAAFHYAVEAEGIPETSEIYTSNDDVMDDADAIQILESSDMQEALFEKMEAWYGESRINELAEVESRIEHAITSENGAFPEGLTDKQEGQLRDLIFENIHVDFPLDRYLKQQFCVNIMLDTGDGNYDFVLNDVYPHYDGTQGEKIDDKASIVWLSRQQGYKKSELAAALDKGDMKGPQGFLESLRVELANCTTHMNALTFLVKMSLSELMTLNRLINESEKAAKEQSKTNCGYIVIDKAASAGLYDCWNGAGGTLDIQLDKDVKIPVKYIRSALPDGGDGYSVEEVYGICESAWETDSVKEIHVPRKFRDD